MRLFHIDDQIPYCTVVEINDSESVVSMIAGGYEIPRVSFPTSVLLEKNLKVGGRFNWIVGDPSNIKKEDIDTNVPQNNELSVEEREELDKLFEAFQQRKAKGEAFYEEFTGDGE